MYLSFIKTQNIEGYDEKIQSTVDKVMKDTIANFERLKSQADSLHNDAHKL